MDTARANQYLHALRMAHACATFGARLVTVQRLTRLPVRDLRRWFFPHPQDAPRGRAPCSTEWYPRANALYRAEASLMAALFEDLVNRGFEAVEALIAGYEHYLAHGQPQVRISFDRAFDLASQVAGRWLTDSPGLSLVRCAECGCRSLASYGSTKPQSCPFCVLIQRFSSDPRVRNCFPAASHLSPSNAQLGITMLLPDVELPERLGIDSTTVQAKP